MAATPIVIVVPCYNEALRLDSEKFVTFAEGNSDVRFLFVDDGSTDATLPLLQEMAHACRRIEFMPLAQNQGKAEAVRQGILGTTTDEDYVGYWDADLATPLGTIGQMHTILRDDPGLDLIMGSRVRLLGHNIERHTGRHYLGRIFATFASLALDLAVYDTQCGAKLFRNTPHLRQLFDTPFRSRWIFDVEIISRLKRLHRELGLPPVAECLFEYPLSAWRDVGGSKLKGRHAVAAVIDLYRIWRARVRP